jgi:hypothetical protein
MRIFVVMLAAWLLVPALLPAACSGASPVWTAASANLADVADCYTAASDGDTVHVPAGDAAWTSPLTVEKELTIVGAGALAVGGANGGTNLTAAGNCFALSHAHNIRVTGFNFIGCTVSGSGRPAEGKAWRVDHCTFRANSWTINNSHGDCQTPQRHPTTLWDHNEFFNYAIHTQGSNCMRAEGDFQDQLWAQAPPFGKGEGVVYVEDNVFRGDNTINWMDGNYAGRYVARFNTIKTGGGYWEVHSVQGDNRAVQMWEQYHNTYEGRGEFFGAGFIRGGSGFIFGLRVPPGFRAIKFNNIRSNEGCVAAGVCQTSGACDGTSAWDQNRSGDAGYACRDQIGRSKDNQQWKAGSAYDQPITPVYMWDNIAGRSTFYGPELHDGGNGRSHLSEHIVQDRDWYTQTRRFDGASGVGVGPISSRPSKCTTGVGYWATDEGEWNSRNAGADGQFYRCTATNTWTLHYIPFQYPHPLQGVEAGEAPTAGAPKGGAIGR